MFGKANKWSKPKTYKQSEKEVIESKRNAFKLKKEDEAIQDRTIRDMETLFEHEKHFYKPIRAGNFWNIN